MPTPFVGQILGEVVQVISQQRAFSQSSIISAGACAARPCGVTYAVRSADDMASAVEEESESPLGYLASAQEHAVPGLLRHSGGWNLFEADLPCHHNAANQSNTSCAGLDLVERAERGAPNAHVFPRRGWPP